MTEVEDIRAVARGIHPRADHVATVRLPHRDILGHGPIGVDQRTVASHPGGMSPGGFHQVLVDFERRQAEACPFLVGIGNQVRFDGGQFDTVDFFFLKAGLGRR